jgi:hypothetical protein
MGPIYVIRRRRARPTGVRAALRTERTITMQVTVGETPIFDEVCEALGLGDIEWIADPVDIEIPEVEHGVS